MERKTGCMSLILTLNDANKDITDQEAKKAVKRMLSALRDKANRENWSYYIFVGFSRSNQGIKAVRPHFHVFLYAEPCWTVSRWIANYWEPPKKSRRKSLGIAKRKKLDGSNAGYFVDGYIRGQSVFTREQKIEDLGKICNRKNT